MSDWFDFSLSDIWDGAGDLFSGAGDAIGSGVDWLFNSDTGKTILNLGGTALSAYALSEIDNLNDKTKPKEVDPGVRLQAQINPYNKVPVIYGKAVLSGSMTDVYMASDNLTMWFVFTLCEVTGKLNLGRGADSKISFLDVYWNDDKVLFNSNGYTVSGLKDVSDTASKDPKKAISTDYAGLIDIYTFSGSSKNPVPASSASTAKNSKFAYQLVPEWIETDNMTNLVFAVVKIKYSKAKNLTSLGNLKFHLQNTMTEPGDCLYDYMTNAMYGAGIAPELIQI